MRYVNHNGRAFDFDRDGVASSMSEGWDWEKEEVVLNGTVYGFRDESREVDVNMAIGTSADAHEVMEELYRVIVEDLRDSQNGYLERDGWRCDAYVKASAKKNADYTGPKGYALTALLLDGYWYRESTTSFFRNEVSGGGVDYEYDYEYDYGGTGVARLVSNPSVYPSDFRMVIYGPATSPYVIIGGNRYEVSAHVPDGAVLIIDSKSGTVEGVYENGDRVNMFGDAADGGQGSGSYIFERIAPGDSAVSWDGTFGFDLTIRDRRDERSWTV